MMDPTALLVISGKGSRPSGAIAISKKFVKSGADPGLLEGGKSRQQHRKNGVEPQKCMADQLAANLNLRKLLDGRPGVACLASLLKRCSQAQALSDGKLVHAHITKNNLDRNTFLGNWLVKMYGDCGSIGDARRVFDNLTSPNLYSWNILMSAYTRNGCCKEAMECFDRMQLHGVKPNQISFVCALDACASEAALDKGRQIHALLANSEYEREVVVATTLVNMYGKCGSLKEARSFFDRMLNRNVVSWNAMISAYAQNGHSKEALEIFDRMQRDGFNPDEVTFVCALDACAGLAALDKGLEIHAAIVSNGYNRLLAVGNALVSMYGKCRSPEDASKVFAQMPDRDVVSWNAMITACTQNGQGKEALRLFNWMQCDGLKPDPITLVCALDACASQAALEKGQQIHAAIVEGGYEGQVVVGTALINMYGKCGRLEDARSIFGRMPHRNVVSWSAMISACARNGHGEEALNLFDQMQGNGFKPDSVAFVCALDACAGLASLEKGQEIHATIMDGSFETHVVVGNALVNMYGKCGSLEEAMSVFGRMPQRDVVSWNAMIAAFAHNGHGNEALDCFMQMQRSRFKPDHVTFLSVLAACSHTGKVDDAKYYFSSMSQDHGVGQKMEHYVCFIDILGRAGRLDDAENLINNMPFENKARVWLCLLGACRLHGDVERGIRAASHVLKSDPENAAPYLLLSNIYAAAGRLG